MMVYFILIWNLMYVIQYLNCDDQLLVLVGFGSHLQHITTKAKFVISWYTTEMFAKVKKIKF